MSVTSALWAFLEDSLRPIPPALGARAGCGASAQRVVALPALVCRGQRRLWCRRGLWGRGFHISKQLHLLLGFSFSRAESEHAVTLTAKLNEMVQRAPRSGERGPGTLGHAAQAGALPKRSPGRTGHSQGPATPGTHTRASCRSSSRAAHGALCPVYS